MAKVVTMVVTAAAAAVAPAVGMVKAETGVARADGGGG
jgi:hypothetical protein